MADEKDPRDINPVYFLVLPLLPVGAVSERVSDPAMVYLFAGDHLHLPHAGGLAGSAHARAGVHDSRLTDFLFRLRSAGALLSGASGVIRARAVPHLDVDPLLPDRPAALRPGGFQALWPPARGDLRRNRHSFRVYLHLAV